jgi:uncharacterized protein YndB with AHSA1/START domain
MPIKTASEDTRTLQHDGFVIEREFAAAPAQVYAAWAEPGARARWFRGPEGWTAKTRELDFRIGGSERLIGEFSNGRVSDYWAHYHDIVADKRIVYSYEMQVDGVRISVSLATVEFFATPKGTRMLLTEQDVFLDGYDNAGQRAHGTRALIEQLAAEVGQAAKP